MNKKRYLFFASVMTAAMLLSGCAGKNVGASKASNTATGAVSNETPSFTTNASNILVTSKNSNTITFTVALFSKKKIKKVEYISLNGKNVDSGDYNVTITDDDTKGLANYKHKGMYMKYIMVEATRNENESAKKCEIQELVLKVNGELQTIKFKTPVKHEFTEGNEFTEALEYDAVPDEFPSSYINNEKEVATYRFTVGQSIQLQKIRFADFLTASNITYSIGDGEEKEAKFPINLKTGQKLTVQLSFKSEIADKYSYLLTNIFFDYVTTADHAKHSTSAVIGFDPIYPIYDNDITQVEPFIDSIIK